MWGAKRRFTGTRVVHLHIGAPKTGTTFLQNALWHNRELLADRGVLYPLDAADEHFAATMDVRAMEWGGRHDPQWDGAWQRIVERVASSRHPRAVVSNELLGGATPDQLRTAIDAFGDAEVHVVFTARDFARALPSDWQEQIRHGHTVTYDQFLDDLITLGRDAPEPFGEMFWDLHDPVTVLPKWAEVVGADRVHVVTVPPAGAPREQLAVRIAAVLDLDPADLAADTDDAAANASLGLVEAELLRRLNDEGDLPEKLSWMYAGIARLELGAWILGRRPGRRRIAIPERHRAWVTEHARSTVDAVRAAGYQVVGDLDDLVPDFSEPDDGGPAALGEAELLSAAVETLADVLLRLGVVQNPPAE